MELAVDVTAYLPTAHQHMSIHPPSTILLGAISYRHGRIHTNHIALFYEQLPRLVAQLSHLYLGYGSTCS